MLLHLCRVSCYTNSPPLFFLGSFTLLGSLEGFAADFPLLLAAPKGRIMLFSRPHASLWILYALMEHGSLTDMKLFGARWTASTPS